MSELIYLGAVLLTLAAYAAVAVALWGAVEGAYYIFCKATKREY